MKVENPNIETLLHTGGYVTFAQRCAVYGTPRAVYVLTASGGGGVCRTTVYSISQSPAC